VTRINTIKQLRLQIVRSKRCLSAIFGITISGTVPLKGLTTYVPYTFATLAGNNGSQDGPPTADRTGNVTSVAVASDGTVYFIDDPNRVGKI